MHKKIFFCLIIAIVTICFPVKAQNFGQGNAISMSRWKDYQRKSYLSIRFGLNVPTIYFRGTGGTAQPTSITRFNVGLAYGNKLGNGLPFYFETGLLYTEKGTEIEAVNDLGRRVCHLKYIEIPFVIKYKHETDIDDLTIQPFFGGFIAMGVAGQIKYYDTRTSRCPFGDDRFRRFDSGIRLGCGIAFQNLYFDLSYDIGLFDIAGKDFVDYNYDDFDGHIRTGNFSATLGIEF